MSIYRVKDKKVSNIILCGFLLRLLMLQADYFHLFPVFGSGGDSEAFHQIALYNAQRGGILLMRTNYTTFLTILYWFTDSSRYFAQFINVLLGTGVLIVTHSTLRLLNISRHTMHLILRILAFMPMLACFSGILLREAWVEFFIVLSLYYFIKWFIRESSVSILFCVASVFAASLMHAGSIVVLTGYFLALLAYDANGKKIRFTASSVVFIVLMAGIITFYLANIETFGAKFGSLEEESAEDVIVGSYEENRGNSAYLTWISVSSPAMGFLFSPLKMFYFLFSPIPFDWRSFYDILAFMLDSLVYLFFCYKIYRHRHHQTNRMLGTLRRFLLINFLILTFVFAFGTGNSGTAIRHRAKFVTMLAVAYAVGEGNMHRKRTKQILHT